MLDVLLIKPGKRKKFSLVAFKERLKYPPMSLMYLASYLEKEGFKVGILDLNLNNLENREILRIIEEKKPRLIGITSITSFIFEAYRLAGLIKSKFDIPLVIGGPHATFSYEEILKESKFDAVVVGEGEESFYEVVKAVKEGKGFGGVNGVSFKKEYKIVNNKPRRFIEDLNKLPFPARHLVDFGKYGAYAFTVLSSRGCPFGCDFCQSSRKDGLKWRYRSAENIVEEIKEVIKRYPNIKKLDGPKGKRPMVHFIDDNFMLFTKRVEEISKLLIKEGVKIYWSGDARVDTIADISDDFLDLIKKSGCIHLYMGVESGSEKILEAYNKRIKKEQVLKAARRLKEKGIYFTGSFILGYVDEDKKDFRATIEFAKKVDPAIATFTILIPFPGTPIYEKYKKEGLIKNFNYSNYIITKQVIKHKEDLEKWLRKAYRSFYLRPRKRYLDIGMWKLFKDLV